LQKRPEPANWRVIGTQEMKTEDSDPKQALWHVSAPLQDLGVGAGLGFGANDYCLVWVRKTQHHLSD